MRYLLYIILVIIILKCCNFAWPGDQEFLKSSCGVGFKACERRLETNFDGVSSCQFGFQGCMENIEGDGPKDWQPADAFYDGCADACSNDNCKAGCSAGQDAIAAASGPRLRKYGTITAG